MTEYTFNRVRLAEDDETRYPQSHNLHSRYTINTSEIDVPLHGCMWLDTQTDLEPPAETCRTPSHTSQAWPGKDLVSLRRRRQETCERRTRSQPHKSFNPMLQFLVCYSTNTEYLLYARHSVSSGSIAVTESVMASESTDLSLAGEMER